MGKMGNCKKCGACCRWLHVATVNNNSVDWDFVHARGLRTVERSNGLVSLYIECSCKYYDKATKECSIHDNRPLSCIAYPLSKDIVLPECNYYKEEDEDGENGKEG